MINRKEPMISDETIDRINNQYAQTVISGIKQINKKAGEEIEKAYNNKDNKHISYLIDKYIKDIKHYTNQDGAMWAEFKLEEGGFKIVSKTDFDLENMKAIIHYEIEDIKKEEE